MIINQGNGPVVPDKTIAMFPVIPDDGVEPFNINDVSLFLKPLNTTHKREWFTSHFYNCLPLSIANMQGFVFSIPYEFDIFWNGENNTQGLIIKTYEDSKKYCNKNFINLSSEFGHGILTIHFPLILKTPPGVNLMTIAPPNYPIPGMSVMSGVIESDNLRFTFTLNLKIDLPNLTIKVLPNTPLVGMIPIPRNYCDSFKLQNAYNIFDENIIKEEINVVKEHTDKRNNQNLHKLGPDKLYFRGFDVKKNKFKEHQLPKKSKS
jgi:hypothetical protein